MVETTRAKDMTLEQITHAYCSYCSYKCFEAGNTYWGCKLEESKKKELCPYEQAVRKEEEEEQEHS